MKMTKIVCKGFAAMLTKVAAANVGTTSLWLMYQPTPPKKSK